MSNYYVIDNRTLIENVMLHAGVLTQEVLVEKKAIKFVEFEYLHHWCVVVIASRNKLNEAWWLYLFPKEQYTEDQFIKVVAKAAAQFTTDGFSEPEINVCDVKPQLN